MRGKIVVTFVLMLLVLSLFPILGGWNQQSEAEISEPMSERWKEHTTSYVVHSPITIGSDAGFVPYGFPGNGSESNPYRIENLNITGSPRCILIQDVTVYYVISGCYLKTTTTTYENLWLYNAPNGVVEDTLIFGGGLGLIISNSDNLVVENCTITGVSGTGLYVGTSDKVTITSVTTSLCGDSGMSSYTSNHLLIQNCTVSNSTDDGIYLGSGNYSVIRDCEVFYSGQNGIELRGTHTRIIGNDVHNNGLNGDHMGIYPATAGAYNCTIFDNDVYENSYIGIYWLQANRCNVTHNRIFDNGEYGIFSFDTHNNTITDNLIFHNNDYGIFLMTVYTSWVYMNDIAWNTWNGWTQGCSGILWDNNETEGVGNWWGDYDGSPPYAITGGGANRFPHISLNASTAAPIEVEYGSTGNIMNWTQASARNPSHYEVYANGALFENKTWDGLHIEVNVDSLDFGYYEMNLTVYHVTGHSANSISYANVTDTTSPVWDVAPTNQVAEYGDHFMYNVSATDLRGIVHYTLNDTSYFSISDQGSITNTSQVPIGIHDLEARAYDPSSLSCIAFITITVSDAIAPSWNMTIEPQVVEYGESFAYQLGATDISGIQNWNVNDTIHFTIVDGLITNITALDAGTYFLNVSIEDIHGNTLFEVFTVTVSDTTSPTWTMTPENQVLEYGESLSYQLSATDLSGIGMWYVNDTTHFSIVDGLLTNLGTLESGIYHLEITVQDIYGNPLTVLISVTVGEQPITTPTTTTTTSETTTTTTPTGTPDNTMMIVILGGVGAAIVVVILIVAMKKRS